MCNYNRRVNVIMERYSLSNSALVIDLYAKCPGLGNEWSDSGHPKICDSNLEPTQMPAIHTGVYQ